MFSRTHESLTELREPKVTSVTSLLSSDETPALRSQFSQCIGNGQRLDMKLLSESGNIDMLRTFLQKPHDAQPRLVAHDLQHSAELVDSVPASHCGGKL